MTRCPAGVEPSDAAAWALDAQPLSGIDLAAHVPTCGACQAVVADLSRSRAAAETLRAGQPTAPPAVTTRAVGRVRLEASAWLLARTLGGALARVAAAVPDYLTSGREPHPEKGGPRA